MSKKNKQILRLAKELVQTQVTQNPNQAVSIATSVYNTLGSQISSDDHPIYDLSKVIDKMASKTGRGKQAVKDAIRSTPLLLARHFKDVAPVTDQDDKVILHNGTEFPSKNDFRKFCISYFQEHNRCPAIGDSTEGTIFDGYNLTTVLEKAQRLYGFTPLDVKSEEHARAKNETEQENSTKNNVPKEPTPA